MPKPLNTVNVLRIKLPREQLARLGLLQAALEETMQQKMTLSELVEKIIADFLEK